jgi:hemoglobin
MQAGSKVLTHFERIGGAEKVRGLVVRFYQLMDELPEAYGIRKLHAPDLQGATDKLYKFLTGWMGGPPLYVDEYGHPAFHHHDHRTRPVVDVHESGVD